jgi:flagellar hook-associated protein 2
MGLAQAGQNAIAMINGVQVESSSNEYAGVTGMTLQFKQLTTSPVELTVGRDTDAVKTAVASMVTAYNALSTTLAGLVKYDAGSKTAGPFQGDSTVTSMQFALRRLVGAAGPDGQKRLSDMGVRLGADGKLSVNDNQLNVALTTQWASTKEFFSHSSNGFAVKLKGFAEGLLNTRGALTTKSESLQSLLNKNSKDQDTVNSRAARVETDLRRQYNALDARLGQLGALNNYVTQQISAWNKNDN